MTKEILRLEVEEILELKAEGRSDREIRKKLSFSYKEYDKRLKVLQEDHFFKKQTLNFLLETGHRLIHARGLARDDYEEAKEARVFPAAAANLKRMIEIDMGLARVCVDMGWRVEDLQRYVKEETIKDDFKGQTQEDLNERYRKLVGSLA